MPAAVLQVAALAGARVVEWPETVRGDGGRGGGDPDTPEHSVADAEIQLLFKGQITRSQ